MIEIECFLVVKADVGGNGYCRGRPSVRVAKKTPSLAVNEVPVALTIRLPPEIFRRPRLQAKIEIPKGSQPDVISAEVAENIADAIKKQTGMEVSITVG